MVGKVVLPRSVTRRLISTLMSSHASSENKGDVFKLKSTSEFASRSKNVFGELKELETDHQKWVSEHETHDSFENSECQNDQPPQETFKKPLPPVGLKRKANFSVPDFRKNPRKWKKYSLADTPLTTDAGNVATAMKFLKELKKNQENEAKKLVFSKPQPKNPEEICDTFNSPKSFSHFATAKLVMPECVVGMNAPKLRMKKQINTLLSSGIKLDHLDESSQLSD